MSHKKTVVGHDYGAPNHEGVPGLYEPYVATAHSDGTCDFEKLPIHKGKATDALEIARKRYDEVIASEARELAIPCAAE